MRLLFALVPTCVVVSISSVAAQTIEVTGGASVKTSAPQVSADTPEHAPHPIIGFIGTNRLEFPATGDGCKLVFLLTRSTPLSLDDLTTSDFGALKFVDRLLLQRLRSSAPTMMPRSIGESAVEGRLEVRSTNPVTLVSLDVLQACVVDELVTRATTEGRTMTLEHRIEVTGDSDSVTRALALLQDFVAANRTLFRIDVAFVTTPEDEQGEPDNSARVSILDAAAYEKAKTDLRAAAGSKVISSPSMTCYAGQKGSASVINQVPYIADFEVEIAQGVSIADPVIKIAKDGVEIGITAVVAPDGDSILIAADAWVGTLQRPMRSFETELMKGGPPVTIQLPAWDEIRWSSEDLALGDGERAIRVDGLHLTTIDEKGGDHFNELHLLIGIERVEPRQTEGNAIGWVMGADAATGKVFLRLDRSDGSATTLTASRIAIWRDEAAVGECTVLESLDGVLVLKLVKGEAKAGDRAR